MRGGAKGSASLSSTDLAWVLPYMRPARRRPTQLGANLVASIVRPLPVKPRGCPLPHPSGRHGGRQLACLRRTTTRLQRFSILRVRV